MKVEENGALTFEEGENDLEPMGVLCDHILSTALKSSEIPEMDDEIASLKAYLDSRKDKNMTISVMKALSDMALELIQGDLASAGIKV